jgi:hypothetical protein
MNIIKFETNSNLDKSLTIVIDLALKAGGMQVIDHVNAIRNSVETISETEDARVFEVAPEVVEAIQETEISNN